MKFNFKLDGGGLFVWACLILLLVYMTSCTAKEVSGAYKEIKNERCHSQ